MTITMEIIFPHSIPELTRIMIDDGKRRQVERFRRYTSTRNNKGWWREGWRDLARYPQLLADGQSYSRTELQAEQV